MPAFAEFPHEVFAMSIEELESAFNARSLAIVGASENPTTGGNFFIRYLLDQGYDGRIYPVSSRYSKVYNFTAYGSLSELPDNVDYVICCIPATDILSLLDECPDKGVKVVHLFTGRFSETGDEGAAKLERAILHRAKDVGVRIIGPNCMGVYYPKKGLSFAFDLPSNSGPVGAFLQSGGVSIEFIRYCTLKGIRFSKVISYGNALDLNECDFLEYFAQDDETKVIVSYIEGVKDGRKFINLLREAVRSKPVVLLKAGQGEAGARSVLSHTGSMAGIPEIWDALIKHTGAIESTSFEEMIDIVLGLCSLKPFTGRKIAVIGGGGGRSVLSADGWGKAGFTMPHFPPKIMKEIKKNVSEMWWKWIGNPLDISMMPESAWFSGLTGKIMQMAASDNAYDFIVYNFAVESPFGKEELILFMQKEVGQLLEVVRQNSKPVIVVMNGSLLNVEKVDDWRWKMISEIHTQLTEAGVPVYATIEQASRAMGQLADYYKNQYGVTKGPE